MDNLIKDFNKRNLDLLKKEIENIANEAEKGLKDDKLKETKETISTSTAGQQGLIDIKAEMAKHITGLNAKLSLKTDKNVVDTKQATYLNKITQQMKDFLKTVTASQTASTSSTTGSERESVSSIASTTRSASSPSVSENSAPSVSSSIASTTTRSASSPSVSENSAPSVSSSIASTTRPTSQSVSTTASSSASRPTSPSVSTRTASPSVSQTGSEDSTRSVGLQGTFEATIKPLSTEKLQADVGKSAPVKTSLLKEIIDKQSVQTKKDFAELIKGLTQKEILEDVRTYMSKAQEIPRDPAYKNADKNQLAKEIEKQYIAAAFFLNELNSMPQLRERMEKAVFSELEKISKITK